MIDVSLKYKSDCPFDFELTENEGVASWNPLNIQKWIMKYE